VEIKNRERLLSETWKQEESFLNLLYQNKTEVIGISNKLVQINTYDEPNAFKELASILKSKKIDNYSLYIQYFIATYCIIFVTRKIKQGDTHRGQELLDLYDYTLNKGIFTLNESMSFKQYNNIIGVASKLENYKWARKSVDEWAHKVDRYYGKSIAIYGHSTIDFHQKKYEKVVQALAPIKFTNFQYRFSSRWLFLRAQFELNIDYVDVIKTQIDNFRRFIISHKSKINKQTFEGLSASLKILNMLLDRKVNHSIVSFYSNSKYVFERKWVLEKIKNPVY
jgi:hypothetical protein